MPSRFRKFLLILTVGFCAAFALAGPAAADCSNVRFRFRFVDDTVAATILRLAQS